MKNLVLLVVFFFCIKVTNAQSSNNIVAKINYDVCSVDFDFTIDTTPATMPSDYYDYCGCTQGLVSYVSYPFEYYNRMPFTNKRPAKYLLCSIVSLDSIKSFEVDSALRVLHMSVLTHGIYYSPYALVYDIPPLDDIEGEGFSTIVNAYDEIMEPEQTGKEMRKKFRNIDIWVFPQEIPVLKIGMSDSRTNLFLLNVSENLNKAYQFFIKGEYDLSSLYSQEQYYKCIKRLLLDYIGDG